MRAVLEKAGETVEVTVNRRGQSIELSASREVESDGGEETEEEADEKLKPAKRRRTVVR